MAKDVINPATGELLLDSQGREIPDPTPMAPPVGYKKQESLFDIVREQIRQQLRIAAEEAAVETEEDADDFDIGDDYDPEAPTEYDFDHIGDPPPPAPQSPASAGDGSAAGAEAEPPEAAPSASQTPGKKASTKAE